MGVQARHGVGAPLARGTPENLPGFLDSKTTRRGLPDPRPERQGSAGALTATGEGTPTSPQPPLPQIAVPEGPAFLSAQRPLGPAPPQPGWRSQAWPCWGQPLLTLPPKAWMVRPQPAASDPRSGPTQGRPGGQSTACPTPDQVPPLLMKLPHTRAVSHGGSGTCRGVGTHTGERKRAQRGHTLTRGWCRATGHHPVTSRGGSGKQQLLPARSAPTPDNRRVCSEYGAGPAARGQPGDPGPPPGKTRGKQGLREGPPPKWPRVNRPAVCSLQRHLALGMTSLHRCPAWLPAPLPALGPRAAPEPSAALWWGDEEPGCTSPFPARARPVQGPFQAALPERETDGRRPGARARAPRAVTGPSTPP